MRDFTDLFIKSLAKKAASGEFRGDLREGDGFGVTGLPSGRLSFFFLYHFGGRKRRLRLGVYDPKTLTLSQARAAYRQAAADVAGGIDPGVKKQQGIAALKEQTLLQLREPTFADALSEFKARELDGKASGAELYRLLQKDALLKWKRRKVKDITRRDITLLLDAVRERAPVTANRLHGRLSRFFNFCVDRGIIDTNPMARMTKPQEKPKETVLNDDDIKRFWEGIETVGLHTSTVVALKLILVTGQRPGEVAGLELSELNTDHTLWSIPADRMKSRRPHDVPLTDLARELIDRALAVRTSDKYLFAPVDDDKPVAVRSLSRALVRKREELGLPAATPHDLRRTCRTGLAALSVNDLVAELILAHTIAGMARIYNRHSYLSEKTAALQAWADHIRRIVTGEIRPTNVVPLARA